MNNRLVWSLVFVVVGLTSCGNSSTPSDPTAAVPIAGLTQAELADFRKCEERFKHSFTVEEGLGPLFNDRSCFACHGSPGIAGGPGSDLKATQCTRIARRQPHSRAASLPKDRALTDVYSLDIDELTSFGGPVMARKCTVLEYPEYFKGKNIAMPVPSVPKEAEFISTRQAGQLFGSGLLQAVPDSLLDEIALKQRGGPRRPVIGRCAALLSQFGEQQSYGRFGWKAQHTSLLSFSVEAMQFEMGLTTPPEPFLKTPTGRGNPSAELTAVFPKNPENDGTLAAQLAYFMALLAPPERGPITESVLAGEKVFEKSGCTMCHVPELKTDSKVMIPAPDAVLPNIPELMKKYGQTWYANEEAHVKLVEIKALENKPVRAYTDLLIHKVGLKLADGIPQGVGGGDYWRTTPLWGLRNRKYLLHDGRTTDLTEAIMAHGGQAEASTKKFEQLSPEDKQALLDFLKSL